MYIHVTIYTIHGSYGIYIYIYSTVVSHPGVAGIPRPPPTPGGKGIRERPKGTPTIQNEGTNVEVS